MGEPPTGSTAVARGTARRSRASAPGQRARLLAAMIDLAAVRGHTAVTVGGVIDRAGVSRATFYEHFDDRDDCFLAALEPHAARLRAAIEQAVAAAPPQRAPAQALGALVAFAQAEPAVAHLLLADTLAGGRRVRASRQRVLAAGARALERASAGAPADASVPDLPPALLLGTGARLLAARLRAGGSLSPTLAAELQAWLAAYEQPLGAHGWRGLAGLRPPRSPFLPPTGLRSPPPLPPGRPRLAQEAVAENHFMRIVFATAEVVGREGYEAATVTGIARAAGVEPRAFYARFNGKRQALAAVTELLFRHVMALTAGAYVAGETWPGRVWEAARALTQAAEQNPTLASVALLEAPAGLVAGGGPTGDLPRAFTVFLQEGARELPDDTGGSRSVPSELALEAIATAVFELGYQSALARSTAGVSAPHAHVAFIALAPFIGAAAAGEYLHTRASEKAPRNGGAIAA